MAEVTIRELRNHGGDVVDRASRGEEITITRAGRAVATLHAIPEAPPVSGHVLLSRWRALPQLDPVALRRDLDAVVDASL